MRSKKWSKRLAVVLAVLLAAYCLVPAVGAAAPASSHIINNRLELHSSHVLLARLDDGKVLLNRGGDEKIYPASMTKIMTVLVAIENLDDLSRKIEIGSGAMWDYIYERTASTAGISAREQVSLQDLLYGAMLPSGAECSITLAEHIAGSEEGFVALMNDKAARLGMTGTHFANVTGLHDLDHYTSLEDTATLLRYALQNETFYQVFTTREHLTAPTNLNPEGLALPSTLFARIESPEFPGGAILGGKTGFTNAAGQCLASLAEKDGATYLLITAGARPEDVATQVLHIEDAFTVYGALRYKEDIIG